MRPMISLISSGVYCLFAYFMFDLGSKELDAKSGPLTPKRMLAARRQLGYPRRQQCGDDRGDSRYRWTR
jgi:hypothetical protein